MEPPPLPLSTTTTTTHLGYPDSVDSSPRSRNTDSWDDPFPPAPGAKLRLMCSYGGHIVPRPHDKSLCYLGGDTRIIVVDRHFSLADISLHLSRSLLNGRSFTLKYQLPNEDLDSLISVTTDEDLDNMIEEYDRSSSSSLKPSRLRLFLFPSKPESSSSIGSLLDDSKSETWFVDALNGSGILPRGLSADSATVNCLLGLDDVVHHVDTSIDVEAQNDTQGIINKQVKHGQDVHSIPDSPLVETSSSFGSTSSSPSMSNLPPIRVHVEDQKVGLDEHFSQLTVDAAAAHKQDEAFVVMCSPPPLPTIIATGVPAVTINSTTVVSENPNRLYSDDERSDQGVSIGFRKPPQPPPSQLQQKTSGGIDLSSPDGSTRDNSTPNMISRAKPMFYQDPVVPIASRDNRVSANPADPKRDLSDPSYRIQMQQVQDSGYVLHSQFDQQQQLQQQQQQQQQFVHAGAHYIQQHATGPVPMSSYYPMYPQQQQHPHHQLEQQYSMYFVPIRQTQPYNLSVQSNLSDADAATITASRPPMPPNPSMIPTPAAYKEPAAPVIQTRSVPPSKHELASNVYRTGAAAAPPLVHMPSDQQQYVGYHQMHHPSQSIAATANYAYEFTDPTHAQIYYTQAPASTLPSQYQTMNLAPATVASETSAQLPLDNTKQQIRTS